MSGRDGAAGDCVAMVQESWETWSNGAVLLLKNGGVGWRCYMECGIFVATVQMTPEGAGCDANLNKFSE